MADVFISHATLDRPLVDEFVQLLEGGIGIRSNQIFCTSLESQGVPPGVDFKEYIRSKLEGSQVVVGLISARFYNSAFCMCELGATWVQAKEFTPLLVPPITDHDLRGVLGGTQCLSIDRATDLDTVYSTLQKIVSDAQPVVRWNARKDAFLKKLPSIVQSLPRMETIKRSEYEKLKAERNSYEAEYKKVDGRVAELENLVKQLSELKDREGVSDVFHVNIAFSEHFEELLSRAQTVVKILPDIVKEALYYRFKGEEFFPSSSEWGNAPKAEEEDGLLEGDGSLFWVNERHPKIRRAVDALTSLQTLVEGAGQTASDWYEQQYDDLLSLKSRAFWKRHHLLEAWRLA